VLTAGQHPHNRVQAGGGDLDQGSPSATTGSAKSANRGPLSGESITAAFIVKASQRRHLQPDRTERWARRISPRPRLSHPPATSAPLAAGFFRFTICMPMIEPDASHPVPRIATGVNRLAVVRPAQAIKT
jgi:hypothetical protein